MSFARPLHIPTLCFRHSTRRPRLARILSATTAIQIAATPGAVNQLVGTVGHGPSLPIKPITFLAMASPVKRPLDPKPSPQEWLNVKNDIERLYVFECHNLRYVAHVLRHRRGFIATLRMFKSRIKEWSFDQKTIRQADWRFMFQQYVQRKKLSTPKETIFRVCQDRHGRVTKYKTIKHIRTYMRRKQVSEDDFLSSPSDGGNFAHIRCITPPLSPTLSSASASPTSQVEGYNADAITPASVSDVASADSHGISRPGLQNLAMNVYGNIPRAQADGSRSDHLKLTTTHCDSVSTSQEEIHPPQARAPPFGRRSEYLPPGGDAYQSSATTNEIMLHGSERMAIQTFALDKNIPCEDVELYRSVARSPCRPYSEVPDIDDDLSAIDLARTLSDFDEDVYDEQDRRSLVQVPGRTDIISARLNSFQPDVDEARAFRWASRYFLACILQGRKKLGLANAARASATKIFERMLESETRSPFPSLRQPYVPSHRSRFILSGLSLMTTVLNAHGRSDMLKSFLLDSRSSIERFFRMQDHPLSAPYSYLLSLMDDDDDHPVDDEFWERTLSGAHTMIRHVWNGGPNAVVSHYYWAWHILRRKRYAEAIEQLNICYGKALEMFGECHIITINCLSTIARALHEQGMYHEAMPCLVDTVKRSQEALGPEHPFCYKLIERVGDLHLVLGNLASAEAMFKDVVEGRKKSLGLHHGHTSFVAHKLANLLTQQGRETEGDKLVKELDDEYEEQQNQHWEETSEYFPDWRHERFTHPSLNIRTLIGLH
jgi:hypothetical protein